MTVCLQYFPFNKAVPRIVGLLPATVTHVVVNNRKQVKMTNLPWVTLYLGFLLFSTSRHVNALLAISIPLPLANKSPFHQNALSKLKYCT